ALGAPLECRVALEEDILRILTGRVREPSPLTLLPPLEAEAEVEGEVLPEFEGAAPGVVSLLNTLLLDGLKQKAEEIRFDPRVAPPVALRIGDAWTDARVPDGVVQNLVRRLKVMANLDIGNRARPQHGFFQLALPGGRARFDVSIEPVGGGDEAARVVPISR